MNIAGKILEVIKNSRQKPPHGPVPSLSPNTAARSSKVEILQTRFADTDTVESLTEQNKNLREWNNYQNTRLREKEDTIFVLKKRAIYLATLLSAIQDSETATAHWEELLLILKLTIPDRIDLNEQLQFIDAKEVINFLVDEDLK